MVSQQRFAVVLLVWAGALGASGCARTDVEGVQFPAPAVQLESRDAAERRTAVFAGGCFWGVEGVFEHVKGVTDVVSGYAGGDAASAQYRAVSGGGTQHAEAVRIEYDPSLVSYGELLKVFFSVAHDPTQLNRQGPDVGPQYRSAVFFEDEHEQRVVEAYISQLQAARVFRRPIVTQAAPLEQFYPAEAYHQDYARRNPNQPYIVVHDLPKIERLKLRWPELYVKQK